MTVPITGSVKDVTGVEDNDTPWSFASVIRFADDGSVITEKPREVRAVSGNLKVNLVPGYAIVTYGKQVWQVTVPTTPTTLKALIEAGVAFPPDTPQELLTAAVAQAVIDNADSLTVDTVERSGDTLLFKRGGATLGSPIDISDLQVTSDTYALAFPDTTITYDGDNVSTVTEEGVTTTYTYNVDGTVDTDTRLGVTRQYTYDGDGNLTTIEVI